MAEREQRQHREAQLRQDLADAEVRSAEEQSVIDEAKQMLNRAQHQVESDEGVRDELETARTQAREQVRQCRQEKQQADVALNRSEVRHRELLTQREALSHTPCGRPRDGLREGAPPRRPGRLLRQRRQQLP